MKFDSVKYLIKFSFILLLSFILKKAMAQEERGYLTFKGETYLNNVHLANAQVKVFRNGRLFTQTSSSKRGRFDLKLEYFHQYKIEFTSQGCYKMYIDVNTDIPKEMLPLWATFVIKIPFFNEKDTTVDASSFKQSITNVVFDTERKKFIDQNQFKTNSPVPNNFSTISSRPISESVIKNSNIEKKEIIKQDSKENIAIKRKEETELIKKVKSHWSPKNTDPDTHNKIEWNSTMQKNKKQEFNYVYKKESEKNISITEIETSDLLKKKSVSKLKKTTPLKILRESDEGVFENKFYTKVYYNNELSVEFLMVENFFTGNSFLINNQKVNSTEYYLKLKKYIK